MSGIEIVLLVGVGILVAKKIKDHRTEKKQKQLAEAGLLPQQHGPAQLVTSETRQQQHQGRHQGQHQQQVPGEDESLPLYTPPPAGEVIAGGDQKVHLPSYDETIARDTRHRESESENNSNEINLDDGRQAQVTVNSTSLEASTTPTEGKTRPKKWKLWRKDQAQPK